MSSPDSFPRPEGPASILRGSGSRADAGEAESGDGRFPSIETTSLRRDTVAQRAQESEILTFES